MKKKATKKVFKKAIKPAKKGFKKRGEEEKKSWLDEEKEWKKDGMEEPADSKETLDVDAEDDMIEKGGDDDEGGYDESLSNKLDEEFMDDKDNY